MLIIKFSRRSHLFNAALTVCAAGVICTHQFLHIFFMHYDDLQGEIFLLFSSLNAKVILTILLEYGTWILYTEMVTA